MGKMLDAGYSGCVGVGMEGRVGTRNEGQVTRDEQYRCKLSNIGTLSTSFKAPWGGPDKTPPSRWGVGDRFV